MIIFHQNVTQFSSVAQLYLTLCDPREPARPPCPSPTPRAYSNSCPLSRWCHPTISSSVVPFSSRLQSLPGRYWPNSIPLNLYKRTLWGFPCGLMVKNLPCNAGNTGSIPGSGRSHMSQGNEACTPQLLSLPSGDHEPQQEKLLRREAYAQQLESKAHRQQEDPAHQR